MGIARPQDRRAALSGEKSMAEIAVLLALRDEALRMRYVRLRREIREIVGEIAEQNFV